LKPGHCLLKRWMRFAVQHYIENPFGNPLMGMEVYFLFLGAAAAEAVIARFNGVFTFGGVRIEERFLAMLFVAFSFVTSLVCFGITGLLLSLTKKKIIIPPYYKEHEKVNSEKVLLDVLVYKQLKRYTTIKLNFGGWLKGDSISKVLLFDKDVYERVNKKTKRNNEIQDMDHFKSNNCSSRQRRVVAILNIVKTALFKEATFCDAENSLAIAVISLWNNAIYGKNHQKNINWNCPWVPKETQKYKSQSGKTYSGKCACNVENEGLESGVEVRHFVSGVSAFSSSDQRADFKNGIIQNDSEGRFTAADYNSLSFVAEKNASNVVTCLMCNQKNEYAKISHDNQYQEFKSFVKDDQFPLPFRLAIWVMIGFWFPLYLMSNRRDMVRVFSVDEYVLFRRFGEDSPYAAQKSFRWRLVGFLFSSVIFLIVGAFLL